jgi:D-alanine-D-alanine ligase
MKKQRVLALVDENLVPPNDGKGHDIANAPWKMEYDVVQTLRGEGHEVLPVGVGSELGVIRKAIQDFQPTIAFNLLESFADVATWDQNVVAYLELMRVPYTGCNSRGLLLARDKALTKKILAYHRVPVPDFVVVPRGRAIRRPRRLGFPLIVKSLTLDASIGISQASVVEDDARLVERVRFIHESIETPAIVEEYVEGRELYVGILGNQRLQVLPTWELDFSGLPEEARRIATERLKWSMSYQKKHGITTGAAKDLPEPLVRSIAGLCKRVSRSLMLSGYARIDLRLTGDGRIVVLEANPNPQLAYGEDFAESAEHAGLAYPDLIQRIVTLGLSWRAERSAAPQ